MPKFTQFGWNRYGELVYRNTGRTAPSDYFVRNGTVYRSADNAQGRVKVGQIGKGTAAQQRKIERVSTGGGRSAAEVKGRYSFNNIRRARQIAKAKEPTLQLKTPVLSDNAKKNFGKSVRAMAEYLTGPQGDATLRAKIKNMTDENLNTLYAENEMVFDVYFDYGGIKLTDKGLVADSQVKANAKALVDTYEKRFGTIPIQTVLP